MKEKKAPRRHHAVLIVIPWSPDLAGGVSVVVRNLLNVWKKENMPATVIINDWKSRSLTSDGSWDHFRFDFGTTTSIKARLKLALTAPTTLVRTWWLLYSRRITCTIFHYPSTEAYGVALLKQAGWYRGELILAFHGSDVRKPEVEAERRWNTIFRHTDAVVACSKSLAKRVEACFALSPASVVPVYNGVDTEIFNKTARVPHLASEIFHSCSRYIVTVGTFTGIKGHKYLIEAFAAIALKYPDLGLVLIGRDGDQRSSLEKQAELSGLKDRIQFRVGLDPKDVARIVGSAVVSVQPSLEEAFGMAVIEAGASGTCVVASAVGGHLELLENGTNGLLFAPANVQSMVEALEKILDYPEPRLVMETKFQQEVLESFTWAACARAYLSSIHGCPKHLSIIDKYRVASAE